MPILRSGGRSRWSEKAAGDDGIPSAGAPFFTIQFLNPKTSMAGLSPAITLRVQACDYRSKARPMRKVWNDSFRLMLTLLDGEDVQLDAGLDGELVQRVARPKVLV